MRKVKLKFILTTILCLCLLAGGAFAATDPLEIGVGARPLALGKAYTAIAEGPQAVFTNPAGLGGCDHWEATTMNANLMSEIGYVVLGGVLPVQEGQSVGLGIVSGGSNGITLRDSSGNVIGSADYNNSVYLLSYGVDLEKTSLGWKNLYVGSNVKIFSQTITGHSSVTDGNASGVDLDLGLLYKANNWLSLGYSQQNVLPHSLGGGMTYANGYSEGIPTVTKLGSNSKILGAENKALYKAAYDLNLAIDVEMSPTEKKPALWHVGSELKPAEFLSLRIGLDHDATSGSDTAACLTAGVGIEYQGFAFDYAYHPYGELSQDATHFFSFSYYGVEEEPVIADAPTPEAKKIELVSFDDVPSTYWAHDAIVYSATAGIVKGYPDGTFKPDAPISRAELSALLTRVKDMGLKPVFNPPFNDVAPKHWAARNIMAAKEENMINGYPDFTFRPERKISRAEGTSLFARFEELELNSILSDKPFPDVATKHWAASEIEAAQGFGFLDYLEGMYFRPDRQLTRAEAVAMLSKTTLGKLKIDEFFGYNVAINEGPYPYEDFYVAATPKTKTIVKKTYNNSIVAKKEVPKKKTVSNTQNKYAQARDERLKKIKAYLKDSRGVYITGTTKMQTASGKYIVVYVLSDRKFLLVEDTGKKLYAVNIYDPTIGKWTPLSIDTVATLNQ
ncbi:MAG: PorV/PorQ family protein [Candidatus Margulisbacteria bacterium]|nr:PorV/PorQ family protein [Candidatus Margulisiibacteriota bacterium]MBU1022300.1 PorV/PorQ family protein [Candidatus Margulisiibacteriota bacterium]MBU1729913.1 PorV/PorQ family protein [Candidatus Margulisiibacteriota bacterium]MBU1955946.1 PorV/PorQ family protein [Candidatus Margulisiibacteriota bacterium]